MALNELLFVAAAIARRFHITFAPGEDGIRFKSKMRDCFTPKPRQVDITIRIRQTL